jgi:hypothetical protein
MCTWLLEKFLACSILSTEKCQWICVKDLLNWVARETAILSTTNEGMEDVSCCGVKRNASWIWQISQQLYLVKTKNEKQRLTSRIR